MGTRLIRLLAAASILACALAAGMAPATMAASEDLTGTVAQAVEDLPPIEITGEPVPDPTVAPEPSLDAPPPVSADQATVDTVAPAPTESPPPETLTTDALPPDPLPPETLPPETLPPDALPPESPAPETLPPDPAGTDVDPVQGLATDAVDAVAVVDVPPPIDPVPAATPAADPPQVEVTGITVEPPAIPVAEAEAPALDPSLSAPSAKPATRPRTTAPAPSVRTAPRVAAKPAVVAAAVDSASAGIVSTRTRRPASGSDQGLEGVAAAGAGLVAGLAVTGRAQATIAVAVEFGRAGGGWAGALVFNIWLRRQLRERRISQRQLAALSGVDHTTISRLLSEDRRPTLATATKLVGALRHIGGEEAEPAAAAFFDRLPEETVFPARRVELALRADELLDEEEVRHLMSIYLKTRRRHLEPRVRPAPIARLRSADPPDVAVERRR